MSGYPFPVRTSADLGYALEVADKQVQTALFRTPRRREASCDSE